MMHMTMSGTSVIYSHQWSLPPLLFFPPSYSLFLPFSFFSCRVFFCSLKWHNSHWWILVLQIQFCYTLAFLLNTGNSQELPPLSFWHESKVDLCFHVRMSKRLKLDCFVFWILDFFHWFFSAWVFFLFLFLIFWYIMQLRHRKKYSKSNNLVQNGRKLHEIPNKLWYTSLLTNCCSHSNIFRIKNAGRLCVVDLCMWLGF